MAKITIKNLGVYSNSKNRIIDEFSSSKKMKFLLTMLRDRFDKHLLGSQIHMLKWIGAKGYINIAFQVLEFQPVNKLNTLNPNQHDTSCSLIFSQNTIFNISISILHTSLNTKETDTIEKKLGTYNFNELDDTIIIEKFDQFVNSIAA